MQWCLYVWILLCTLQYTHQRSGHRTDRSQSMNTLKGKGPKIWNKASRMRRDKYRAYVRRDINQIGDSDSANENFLSVPDVMDATTHGSVMSHSYRTYPPTFLSVNGIHRVSTHNQVYAPQTGCNEKIEIVQVPAEVGIWYSNVGDMVNPNFPLSYTPNTRCEWVLRGFNDVILLPSLVRLRRSELRANQPCDLSLGDDILWIGLRHPNGTVAIRDKYCGSVETPNIFTYNATQPEDVVVHFETSDIFPIGYTSDNTGAFSVTWVYDATGYTADNSSDEGANDTRPDPCTVAEMRLIFEKDCINEFDEFVRGRKQQNQQLSCKGYIDIANCVGLLHPNCSGDVDEATQIKTFLDEEPPCFDITATTKSVEYNLTCDGVTVQYLGDEQHITAVHSNPELSPERAGDDDSKASKSCVNNIVPASDTNGKQFSQVLVEHLEIEDTPGCVNYFLQVGGIRLCGKDDQPFYMAAPYSNQLVEGVRTQFKNAAVGRPTGQSSKSGDSSLAVDGVKNGKCISIVSDKLAYWWVNLQQQFDVYAVQITWPSTSTITRQKVAIYIYTGFDAKVPLNAPRCFPSVRVNISVAAGDISRYDCINGPLRGSMVQLQAQQSLQLCEVEVFVSLRDNYGTTRDKMNMNKTGWHAESASFSRPTNQSKNASDRRSGSPFSSGFATDGNFDDLDNAKAPSCARATSDTADAWWYVDLGQRYIVSTVAIVAPNSPQTKADINNLTVYVSEKLAMLGKGKPCSVLTAAPKFTSFLMQCQELKVGRYVFITAPSTRLTLCEVQVFGRLLYEFGGVLSIGDDAMEQKASSINPVCHSDSIPSPPNDTGSCCLQTRPGQKPSWWWINIESGYFYVVSAVSITVCDTCASEMRNFKVELSILKPEGSISAKDAVLCHHHKGRLPPGTSVTLQCLTPTIARFIRIWKEGDQLTLCNVKIHPGFYKDHKAILNVALGKPIGQDLVFQADEKTPLSHLAVDGMRYPDRNGGAPTCFRIQTKLLPIADLSFQVDLMDVHLIHYVVVVFSDAKNGMPLYARIAMNTNDQYVTCDTRNDVGSGIYNITCAQGPVAGRRVILALLSHTGTLDLCEVEVYGKPLAFFDSFRGLPNVALRGNTSQSTTAVTGGVRHNSSKAVDGITSIRLENCAVTENSASVGQWWMVQLDDFYIIQVVVIQFPKIAWSPVNPRSLRSENDVVIGGGDFFQNFKGNRERIDILILNGDDESGLCITYDGIIEDFQKLVLPCDKPLWGKTVQFFKESGGLALCEVEILAKPAADFYGLNNVALHKYARQITSNTKSPMEDAGRAVDGNVDSDFSHQSCSLTSSTQTAWWYVDLGNVYKIYRFAIVFIPKFGINNIKAEVYPQEPITEQGLQVPGQTCNVQNYAFDEGFLDNNFQNPNGNCIKPMDGRYFKITTSNGPLNLCEVLVYGVPAIPVTWFGLPTETLSINVLSNPITRYMNFSALHSLTNLWDFESIAECGETFRPEGSIINSPYRGVSDYAGPGDNYVCQYMIPTPSTGWFFVDILDLDLASTPGNAQQCFGDMLMISNFVGEQKVLCNKLTSDTVLQFRTQSGNYIYVTFFVRTNLQNPTLPDRRLKRGFQIRGYRKFIMGQDFTMGSDIAKNKKTHMLTYPPGDSNHSQNAVDMDWKTCTTPGGTCNNIVCARPNQYESYLHLDLGDQVLVSAVLIYLSETCCELYMADFDINVTPIPMDTALRTDMNTNTRLYLCRHYVGVLPVNVHLAFPCYLALKGRYIRIWQQIGMMVLCEMQVVTGNIFEGAYRLWEKENYAADQSSSLNWPDASNYASNALDPWMDSWGQTEFNQSPVWWYVDMYLVANVAGVVIAQRTDTCCAGPLHDFSLYVYEHNVVRNAPRTDQFFCTYYMGTVFTEAIMVLYCEKIMRGRYVYIWKETPLLIFANFEVIFSEHASKLISAAENRFLDLSWPEILLHNPGVISLGHSSASLLPSPCQPTENEVDHSKVSFNIAMGKPSWQSSLNETSGGTYWNTFYYGPAQAVDGVHSHGSQELPVCSQTSDGHYPSIWWVDLTEQYLVAGLIIFNSENIFPRHLGFFYVSVSDKRPSDTKDVVGTLCYHFTDPAPSIDFTLLCDGDYITGRYVRIWQELTPLTLCEVQVITGPLHDRNIALGKPTKGSSIPAEGSSKAVDGSRASYIGTWRVCTDDYNRVGPTWWYVDLTDSSNVITAVMISGCYDETVNQFHDFHVMLTNSTPSNAKQGVECYYQADVLFGKLKTMMCYQRVAARYVHVWKSSAVLSLSEVLVLSGIDAV